MEEKMNNSNTNMYLTYYLQAMRRRVQASKAKSQAMWIENQNMKVVN
jgi:hypothetical protein